jgi:hypothetical protein
MRDIRYDISMCVCCNSAALREYSNDPSDELSRLAASVQFSLSLVKSRSEAVQRNANAACNKWMAENASATGALFAALRGKSSSSSSSSSINNNGTTAGEFVVRVIVPMH